VTAAAPQTVIVTVRDATITFDINPPAIGLAAPGGLTLGLADGAQATMSVDVTNLPRQAVTVRYDYDDLRLQVADTGLGNAAVAAACGGTVPLATDCVLPSGTGLGFSSIQLPFTYSDADGNQNLTVTMNDQSITFTVRPAILLTSSAGLTLTATGSFTTTTSGGVTSTIRFWEAETNLVVGNLPPEPVSLEVNPTSAAKLANADDLHGGACPNFGAVGVTCEVAIPAGFGPELDVTGDDGALLGVQRTWLDARQPAKAGVAHPRKALGRIHGHAVRFGRPDGALLVGEGIETVLSLVAAVPEISAAAALSAGSLGAFSAPPGLAHLVIARDNDPEGEQAAMRLARRCARAGVAATVLVPEGGDFNDDLVALGPAALAARLGPLLRLAGGSVEHKVGQADPERGERPWTLSSI